MFQILPVVCRLNEQFGEKRFDGRGIPKTFVVNHMIKKMKKYILLIPAILIMAACSKKNNPAPARLTPSNANATDLVGRWTVITDTTFLKGSSQFNTKPVNDAPYFLFNADGTGSSGTVSIGLPELFNYNVSNGTLILTIPHPNGGTSVYLTYSIYNITKSTLGLRLSNNDNTYEDAWLTK